MRYWNRLIRFDSNRMTKLAFNIDYDRCKSNWCSEVKDLLDQLELGHFYELKSEVYLSLVETNIFRLYSDIWRNSVQEVSKLRTYRNFKTVFETENYVNLNLSKIERSHLAQFRSGILPLRVETGRYSNESVEERLCIFCKNQETETEFHFMFDCPLYIECRVNFFGKLLIEENFTDLNHADKLNI